jgi:hypothetical protein
VSRLHRTLFVATAAIATSSVLVAFGDAFLP